MESTSIAYFKSVNFFSETSLTGKLPEMKEGMTEFEYRKLICENAIGDWARRFNGQRSPRNFWTGMVAAASFLDVSGGPDSFIEYLKKMEILKNEHRKN